MADFCYQCTESALGLSGEENDFVDLAEPGTWVDVLCEGCGSTTVDVDGRCVDPHCIEQHGIREGVFVL